ncbi:MAG: hypothetical protein ACRCY8_18835 [Dermatophilaceae bacterium]
MRRRTVALDRAVVLLTGLLLIAAAVAGFVWWRGDLGLSGPLDTAVATDAAEQPWWPWAVGATGALLVVLGLRWLAAHLRSSRVGALRLPGSGPHGRLTADTGSVARAAGEVLAATPGVRSARGGVDRDRGRLVARLRATIEPEADLATVAAASDRVAADLRTVLQRDDIRCRVDLRVAQHGRNLPRVT